MKNDFNLNPIRKGITGKGAQNNKLLLMLFVILGVAIAVTVLVLFSHSAFSMPVEDLIEEQREPKCGLETHEHGPECYERVLVCDIPECGDEEGGDNDAGDGENQDDTSEPSGEVPTEASGEASTEPTPITEPDTAAATTTTTTTTTTTVDDGNESDGEEPDGTPAATEDDLPSDPTDAPNPTDPTDEPEITDPTDGSTEPGETDAPTEPSTEPESSAQPDTQPDTTPVTEPVTSPPTSAEPVITEPTTQGHKHSDEEGCYEYILVCPITTHTHDEECYDDDEEDEDLPFTIEGYERGFMQAMAMSFSLTGSNPKLEVEYDMDVTIDGTPVENIGDEIQLRHGARLQFNLVWTVKDTRYIIQNGDTLTFPIIWLSDPDYLSILPPKELPLKINNVEVATGVFDWNGQTLEFKVTFNENAKNYIIGGGTATGNARFDFSLGLEELELKFGEELKGKITINPPDDPPDPDPGFDPGPIGVWPPVPPERDEDDIFKGLVSDYETGGVNYQNYLSKATKVQVPSLNNDWYYGFAWAVPFYGLQDHFEEIPDRPATDYVIVEDTLSANLRFAGFDKFVEGANAGSNLNDLFYSNYGGKNPKARIWGDSPYAAIRYGDVNSSVQNFFSVQPDLGPFYVDPYGKWTNIVGENGPKAVRSTDLIMYQSQFKDLTDYSPTPDHAAAEAAVRSTALSYAVTELPDGRQKLIINLGKFGMDVPEGEGIKSSQLLRDFTKNTHWSKMINDFLDFQGNENPYEYIMGKIGKLEELLEETYRYDKLGDNLHAWEILTDTPKQSMASFKADLAAAMNYGSLTANYDTPIPSKLRFKYEGDWKADYWTLKQYIENGNYCGGKFSNFDTVAKCTEPGCNGGTPETNCCNCSAANFPHFHNIPGPDYADVPCTTPGCTQTTPCGNCCTCGRSSVPHTHPGIVKCEYCDGTGFIGSEPCKFGCKRSWVNGEAYTYFTVTRCTECTECCQILGCKRMGDDSHIHTSVGCNCVIPEGEQCPDCSCCNCDDRNQLWAGKCPIGVHIHGWAEHCKGDCNCTIQVQYIQPHDPNCRAITGVGEPCPQDNANLRAQIAALAKGIDLMIEEYNERMKEYQNGNYELAADGFLRGLLFHFPTTKDLFNDILGPSIDLSTLDFEQTVTAIRAQFSLGSTNFDKLRAMYFYSPAGYYAPLNEFYIDSLTGNVMENINYEHMGGSLWRVTYKNVLNGDTVTFENLPWASPFPAPSSYKNLRGYLPDGDIRYTPATYDYGTHGDPANDSFYEPDYLYQDNLAISAVTLWYRTVLVDPTVTEFSNEVEITTTGYEFKTKKTYDHYYDATIWGYNPGEVGLKKADAYTKPEWRYYQSIGEVWPNYVIIQGNPGAEYEVSYFSDFSELVHINDLDIGMSDIIKSHYTTDNLDKPTTITADIDGKVRLMGLALSSVYVREVNRPYSDWDYNIDKDNFTRISQGIVGAKFEAYYWADKDDPEKEPLSFTMAIDPESGVPIYTRDNPNPPTTTTEVVTGINGTLRLMNLDKDIYLVEIGADGYYTGNQSGIINTDEGNNVAMYDIPSGVALKKIDGTTLTGLNGAVFHIEKLNGETWETLGTPAFSGGFTRRTVDGRTAYWYSPTGTTVNLTTDYRRTGSNPGYIYVFGLPEGDYRFVETQAPHGYELPANPADRVKEFTVTIGETPEFLTIGEAIPDSGEGINPWIMTNGRIGAPEIKLLKVGVPEDNLSAYGTPMAGVGFKLVKTSTFDNDWESELIPLKTTGGDGYVRWSSADIMALADNLTDNGDFSGTYMLAEINPPNGVSPIDPIMFTIDSDGTVKNIQLGSNDTNLVSYNNLTNSVEFKIKNVVEPGVVLLHAKKIITGDGAPPASFTFELRQVDKDGNELTPAPTAENGRLQTVVLPTNGEGEYTIYFEPIAGLTETGSPYYFRIKEIPGSDSKWDYDPIEYIVKIEVKNGKIIIYYPDGTVEGGFTTAEDQTIEIIPSPHVGTGELVHAGTTRPINPPYGTYGINWNANHTNANIFKNLDGINNGIVYRYLYKDNNVDNVVVGAAYCIQEKVPFDGGSYNPYYNLEGFITKYPYTYNEILWLIRNGFMATKKRMTDRLAGDWSTVPGPGNDNLEAIRAMGVGGSLDELTAAEAYCATQLAIWHFSDNIDWVAGTESSEEDYVIYIEGYNGVDESGPRIWEAYNVLINAATNARNDGEVITELSLGVNFDTSSAERDGNWYGPVKVNVDLLPVDFTALTNVPVKLTSNYGENLSLAKGGSLSEELPLSHNGTSYPEFYVDIGSIPTDGIINLVTATASLNSTIPVKDVYIINVLTGGGTWSTSKQAVAGIGVINRPVDLEAKANLYYGATNAKLAFKNTFTKRGPVEINVKKTVTFIDTPSELPKTFTFNLVEVDENGDPTEPRYERTATIEFNEAKDDYCTFILDDFPFENGNTYYFRISEQPGPSGDGWIYDTNSYIVTVTVENSVAEATYPAGMTSGTDEHINISYAEKSDTTNAYKRESGYPHSYNYDNSTGQLSGPQDSANFVVCCAEVGGKTLPAVGTTLSLLTAPEYDRTHKESALAFSLMSPYLGGLNDVDFKRFFGLPNDYNANGNSGLQNNATYRANLMHSAVWFYEQYYDSTNTNVTQIDTLPRARGNDGGSPNWGQTLIGYQMAYNVGNDGGGSSPSPYQFSYLNQSMNMLKEMMVQYNADKTTSLNMTYTPINETSGTLTFSHDGFVPHRNADTESRTHSENIKTLQQLIDHMAGIADLEQQYDTLLTWNTTSGVTVKINDVDYTDGPTGVAVRKADVITVTNLFGIPVTFTLVDNGKYLLAGSIKGDILRASTSEQRVITGHAEFVTLKCTLNVNGGSSEIAFRNIYKERESVEIDVRKTLNLVDTPSDLPKQLKFNLVAVDENGDPTVPPYEDSKEITLNTVDTEYYFSFNLDDFPFENGNTYYFEISEEIETAYGWQYDKNVYTVVVVVDNAGNIKIYYPQSGTVEGTGSNNTQKFPLEGELEYTGGEYNFEDDDKEKFIAFCSDKWLTQPGYQSKEGDYPEIYHYINYELFDTVYHTQPALAYAMFNQLAAQVASPSLNEYVKLFGFTETLPFSAITWGELQNNCQYLSKLLVWYYELRLLYPEYDWDPTNLDKWPDSVPNRPYPGDPTITVAARHGIADGFKKEIPLYLGENGLNVFAKAVEMIERMMEAYSPVDDGKCITSLNMLYEPDGDNSGWLSFSYDGYLPPDHDLKLIWTVTGDNVTITKKDEGEIYTGSVSGTLTDVKITDRFYIEFDGTGTVKFTVEDDICYLMNGSIMGDYYRTDNPVNKYWLYDQRMLIGYAKFAKMKCSLTIGQGDYVHFRNKYEEPKIDVKVCGIKTIEGGGDRSKLFTFVLQEVELVDEDWVPKVGSDPIYTNGSADKGFSFTIPNLKKGVYNYRITEIDPEDGCEYDDREYMVKVTVTYDDVTDKLIVALSYTLDGEELGVDEVPEFINKYEGEGPKLPETGGIGKMLLIITGAIILMTSIIAGMYYKKLESIRRKRIKNY